MRPPRLIALAFILTVLFVTAILFPAATPAENGASSSSDDAVMRGGTYSITWDVIASGGGTSSGGGYTISDTIGQAVTGPASGGSYNIDSGYWVFILPGAIPSGGVLIY